MTAEEIVNDMIGPDESDPEIKALYNLLLKKHYQKGFEFIQPARSRLTGNVRYIVHFRPNDGILVQDIETNKEVTVG